VWTVLRHCVVMRKWPSLWRAWTQLWQYSGTAVIATRDYATLMVATQWPPKGGSQYANESQSFRSQRSWNVGQLVGDTLQIGISISICRSDVSFRRYAVSSAEVAKKVTQNLMFFCAPNLRESPRNFGGICKSTPLPTYCAKFGWDPMAGLSSMLTKYEKNKLQRYNIMALPSVAIIIGWVW